MLISPQGWMTHALRQHGQKQWADTDSALFKHRSCCNSELGIARASCLGLMFLCVGPAEGKEDLARSEALPVDDGVIAATLVSCDHFSMASKTGQTD